MIRKIFLFMFFYIPFLQAEILPNCKWDNRKGTPCITITKTPNTSYLNGQSNCLVGIYIIGLWQCHIILASFH